MRRLFLAPEEMSASRRTVPSLDGLRAISILIVLSAHFISSRLFPGGLGVYIFFVISGFLITRLLVSEYNASQTLSLRHFYLRRIVRLYPAIIAFTACVLAMDIVLHRPYNIVEPASALGYFANYLYVYFDAHDISGQMPFAVFWSLSVEEHFYILLPVLFLMLRGETVRLAWAAAGLCIVCLGLRVGMAWLHPEYLTTQIFYSESQYRLDSIVFGMILALACEHDRGRRLLISLGHPVAVAVALAAVAASLTVRDPWFRETFRYTLTGCALDVLIAAILFNPLFRHVQRALNTAAAIWLGRLSYSLYIWHEGVASFLPFQDRPRWQAIIITLLLTIVLAAASYYAIEQPFLRLRRRLGAPQTGAVFQSASQSIPIKLGT
ncbi:MAG TPA: acyltransferase, partial [Rhodopila sp.]